MKKCLLAGMILLSISQSTYSQSFANVISETINSYQNNQTGLYYFHFSIFDVSTEIPDNSYNIISGTSYIKVASVDISKLGKTVKKYFLKTMEGTVLKTTGKSPGSPSHSNFSFETNSGLISDDNVAKLTLTLNDVTITYNLKSTDFTVIKVNSYNFSNGKTFNDYIIQGNINPSAGSRKKFLTIYISQVPLTIAG